MLSRKNRLTAEKDFARLFARGKSFSTRGLGLRAGTNKLAAPRIGFVVSTKVAKRAVVRNLLKRRMREIVRKFLSAFADQGIDIVFIARPEAAKFSFEETEAAITSLLERSGLRKPPGRKSV